MSRSLLPILATLGVSLGLAACGQADRTSDRASAPASRSDIPEQAPLRAHPQVVEPEAGGPKAAEPKRSASTSTSTSESAASAPPTGVSSAAPLTTARALPAGVAIPPLEAPGAVRQIIEAGNMIARTPYLWGGGHGKWVDKGYDCSGSVSFALASAGLLDAPLDSGRLMSWGASGRGKWITVFSNRGHVFLEVAGIRFDTSGARVTGSRWQEQGRSTSGFVARHWPGL
jgi:cell wall-associated NlpC family hydrolase